MRIEKINGFTVNCSECPTSVEISMERIPATNQPFHCPVCNTNLSNDVHGAIQHIYYYNNKVEDILNFISHRNIEI